MSQTPLAPELALLVDVGAPLCQVRDPKGRFQPRSAIAGDRSRSGTTLTLRLRSPKQKRPARRRGAQGEPHVYGGAAQQSDSSLSTLPPFRLVSGRGGLEPLLL